VGAWGGGRYGEMICFLGSASSPRGASHRLAFAVAAAAIAAATGVCARAAVLSFHVKVQVHEVSSQEERACALGELAHVCASRFVFPRIQGRGSEACVRVRVGGLLPQGISYVACVLSCACVDVAGQLALAHRADAMH